MNYFDKKHSLKEYEELLILNGLVTESHLMDKAEREISFISFDSNDIVENTLFICKGIHFKEDYLKDALRSGACCYISENKYDEEGDFPYIIVSDIREAMGHIANLYYNGVSKELKILGITGTKGKSTTTFFTKYILDEVKKKEGKPVPAMLSSISIYDGKTDEPSRITTPEAFEVQQHLKNAYDSGIDTAIMEVSSQALKYNRVDGLEFKAGCFTNIGEDHISPVEHPDWEDYFNTKAELFSRSEVAVVNLDAENADRILEEAKKRAKKVITFGLRPEADVFGYDVKAYGEKIYFRVLTSEFDKKFVINMWGLFNVSNALGAIALAMTQGAGYEEIYEGLSKTRVEGRVQLYTPAHKKLSIIVDYAHNKMSFQTLAESTRQAYPDSSISVVFGAPGSKAFGRRKDLGEIAGRYCNHSYITEDDPADESPVDICNEIAKHVANEGGAYDIIIDRREAIRRAIHETPEGGVVLVIGKGAETSQKRGTVYVDTPSDGEYVEDILSSEYI
ncbi:MAG: UDP-N-acetylmuramoyl-L-alanyl-D-glutamate--2,6-diaminopimelate ligase [Clostridiales bacterium]|nr:UDP-N-acetylmuramoyl-L-alanyl-D-glutamate--2,6-diaminopimelate ligase [Clostridiales bacterium]